MEAARDRPELRPEEVKLEKKNKVNEVNFFMNTEETNYNMMHAVEKGEGSHLRLRAQAYQRSV